MGLDLWFRADVARILASTQETMAASTRAVGGGGELLEVYRQGFEDALRAVGLAFGLGIDGRAEGQQVAGAVRMVEGELVERPVPAWGWRAEG